MARPEPPIRAFRRRLLRLIDEQYGGRDTRFARRAGIPISTAQHYIHNAKHLPGGEHLMRIAAALGVTVQELIAGQEAGRTTARPGLPIPVVQPRDERPTPAGLTIPVVRCGCPGACPLTAAGPLVTAAVSTLVLPAEMLAEHREHRWLATQVGESLEATEWPDGTRLVVDTDARTPAWEDLALIHTEGRCQLGHLTQVETAPFFAVQRDGDFRIIMDGWRILGTSIAVVVPLVGDGAEHGRRTG
jgi:transcriptional regulator with XRE-family HTH domain